MQTKNRICYGKAYTDADVWGGGAEQNKSLKGQRDEEARDPSGREVGEGEGRVCVKSAKGREEK